MQPVLKVTSWHIQSDVGCEYCCPIVVAHVKRVVHLSYEFWLGGGTLDDFLKA
ncbi:hypothetical protein DO70_315 [Burkholderia pseudomallei]|nr:hypothetical protein DO70_315 [Burkholderia pseudomallei]